MKNLVQPGKDQIFLAIFSAARKRNLLIAGGIALLGTLLGFILTYSVTEPQTSYFFLAAIILELLIFFLTASGFHVVAYASFLVGLWGIFTAAGLLRADTLGIMAAGYLVVMIIAGFSFHLRGIVITTTASLIAIIAISWSKFVGLLQPVGTSVNQPALLLVNLLILFMGGVYLVIMLDTLARALQDAKQSQQRYQALLIDSIDGIVILDMDFNLVDVNQTALILTGYSREEVMGLNADQLVVPNQAYFEAKAQLQKKRKVSAFEHQIQHKSGEMIEVENMPTLVMDENGDVLNIQVQMRDVRPRKQVEKYLNEYKQRYDALFDRAEYGFLLIDMNLTLVAANQQAASMLKGSLRDLNRRPIQDLLNKQSARQMENDLKKLLAEGELSPRQLQMTTIQGHSIWVEANIGLVDSGEGQPLYMQWIIRDISDQKKREQQLLESLQEMETLAMTDPLTGLQNRRSIETYSKAIVERAESDKSSFCVILIDVDQLKTINDTLGHQAGDHALSRVAEVLTRSKRRDDVVGRWGGDEFLIILPNTSLSDAEIAAKRIQNQIAKIWIGEGKRAISLAVSMGVAGLKSLPADEPVTVEGLIDLADGAMYKAKYEDGHKIALAR